MKLKARITEKLPLQQGVSKNGNPWSKATLIVETLEQYPKKVALGNMRKAMEFDALESGKLYEFDIDVESREYNGRWYSEVVCWNWTEI